MIITVDGQVEIATGRSRKEINWKNKSMLWSELVTRVSQTQRTFETYQEYLAAKKPRQDEIKDIGGFVGGYLSAGRKKAGNVLNRSIITLDIDHGNKDVWEDFCLYYHHAAALYSTHKHHPDHPRLRLLMPLARAVFADEYVAIARRIAGNVDIELFDDTTFEPSRMMYWPSTSKDGVFEFQVQDGPWLDPDEVLTSYRNWKDSSEWPVSTRTNRLMERSIKKQGDPLEKPGVIGAFCRTYSISAVIETYLSDVYEACDVEGRYTYKPGTTAAGLVVYDDKYAYSHHGTDPVSGRLCNAFDLVRLHKFGLRDEDATNERASNEAMGALATKDEAVKMQIGVERIEGARIDFASSDSNEKVELVAQTDSDWMKHLAVDKKGNYQSSIDNIYLILKHDDKLRGCLCFDEFEGRLIAVRDLPWRKVIRETRDFSDTDRDCLAHYLEGYQMPFTHIDKALSKISNENKVHPVREYLSALTWDGIERLDTLFIQYLGAEDTAYVRAATRKTFIAAVARVMQPAIKFDTVLTLVGKEGIGKSTVVQQMANGQYNQRSWFSDSVVDIHGKTGMESLRGAWIVEMGEMEGFRRAEQESIKRFISSREDIYRPAYGRSAVRYPRQCIFFATTNKEKFLTGSYGNRRFLPIATHVQPPTRNVFKHLTDHQIDQLWAEAVHYYQAGESLDLPEELKATAADVREEHSEMDDRFGMIEQYLNTLLPENWDKLSIYDRRSFLTGDDLQAEGTITREFVCVAEIWCEVLGGMQRDMTNANTKYLHDMMKKMKGWESLQSSKRFKHYGAQRAYKRVNTGVQHSKPVFTHAVNTVNRNVNTKKE